MRRVMYRMLRQRERANKQFVMCSHLRRNYDQLLSDLGKFYCRKGLIKLLFQFLSLVIGKEDQFLNVSILFYSKRIHYNNFLSVSHNSQSIFQYFPSLVTARVFFVSFSRRGRTELKILLARTHLC